MKNFNQLKWMISCLFLVAWAFSPNTVRAQSSITINGATTACTGDMPTYTFTPINNDLIYTWTVTTQGTVLNPGALATVIQWTTAGNAAVTVRGKDASGAVMAQGTLPVAISARPNPVITASTVVKCVPLDVDGKRMPPDDSPGCIKACANSQVTYSVINHPGSTYTWSVNGDISHSATGNTCTVNWGDPGHGDVSVTESNGSCAVDATICVVIIEAVKAKFTTMPDTPQPGHIKICLNSTVIFMDQSISSPGSPITSRVWNFGDGTFSSAGVGTLGGPIQHTYTQPGTYQASLTVANSCGCSSTYGIVVTVVSVPGITIECPRVSCEGEIIPYYVDNQTCQTGHWEATGGTIVSQNFLKANVKWDNVGPSGFGYLSYSTPCGPCPGTTVIAVPVIQPHGTIQGPTSVCPNSEYIYSLPEWPTTKFTWNYTGNVTLLPTDQPNKMAVLTGNSGSFTVGVKYCNTLINCQGGDGIGVTILPDASINGPATVCINTQGTYTLSGAGTANWTLTPPVGSPVVYNNVAGISPTFTQSGTYSLSISGSFCAPPPLDILVRPKPAAPTQLLGPDKACPGVPVLYTAQPALAGTITEWTATPGSVNINAGISTYANFSNLPAQLSVVRVYKDAPHCASYPFTKTIQPEMPPITLTTDAPASHTVCGSTQWHFDVNYVDADLYEWRVINPNMGSVVTGSNTAHAGVLFNNPTGSAEDVVVKVTVTKCGVVAQQSLTLHVFNPPTFTVTPAATTVCASEAVQFNISPTPVNYDNLTWHFGDGGTSGSINPGHIFDNNTQAVTYNPTVTIVHPGGCLSTNILPTGPISVNPEPVVTVNPNNFMACGAFTTTLHAANNSNYGTATNYQWYGPTANPPGCSNCYTWSINQYGEYHVDVTNNYGCTASSNTVNAIKNCPGACPGAHPTLINSHFAYDGCGRATVHMHYYPNGTTISPEHWQFPQGATITGYTTGTNATATATFEEAGNFTFAYVVPYNNGSGPCEIYFLQNVFIPFVGGMSYEVNCGTGNAYTVTLYDHSSVYPGHVNYINHSYSYFNGSSWIPISAQAGDLSATVNLAAGQSYQLKEVINDAQTPAASSCVTILNLDLPDKPLAAFSKSALFLPACVRDVVINFTNSSSPATGLSYIWDFGDDPTNFETSPSKVYATPGPYNIMLTATDLIGCTSTATDQVTIKADNYWDGMPNHKPFITLTPTQPPLPCQGVSVSLTYNLPAGYSQYPPIFTWYKGATQLTLPTSGLNPYGVSQPGGYRVIGTDQYGCVVPSKFKPVNFRQVPPAVISGKTGQCEGVAFTLNGYAGNVQGLTYQWVRSPGGNVGNSPVITEVLSTQITNTYTYTLTLTLDGCTSVSAPFTVAVGDTPDPPTLSYNILNCSPFQVQLLASNSQQGIYYWSNGAVGSPASGYSGGFYQATFTSLAGCTSENREYVVKSPDEYLWIFPTGCICKSILGNACGGDPYITGPIIKFAGWDYLLNGNVDVSGVGLVSPYYHFLSLGPGAYNLELNNGYCTATSGDMYFDGLYCEHTHQMVVIPLGINGSGDSPDLDPKLQNDLKPHGLNGEKTMPILKLVPNPATGQTRVEYRFAAAGRKRNLIIFGPLGRKVARYKLDNPQGSLVLPLDSYSTGIYEVVLKQDGRVILKSKLSVAQ